MHQENSDDLDCTQIIDTMLEAARKRENEVVEWCLERDDSEGCFFREDVSGTTVLKYVVYNDHVSALALMLDRHRSLFERFGEFILIIAVHCRAVNSVDFLLKKFEFTNNELRKAFATAMRKRHEELIYRLLLQRNLRPAPSDVVEIFARGMIECVPSLVASGAVDDTDTLTIVQCLNSSEMVVAFIVHYGTPALYPNLHFRHRVMAPYSREAELAHDAIFRPSDVQSEEFAAEIRFQAYFQPALLDRLLFSLLCYERNPRFSKVKRF